MCFVDLQRLKNTESDRLAVQVHAYLDNMIDVAQLLEDSETKTDALEKVAELEEELSHVSNHCFVNLVFVRLTCPISNMTSTDYEINFIW